MITGAFPGEEKERCRQFIKEKYPMNEAVMAHMTPIKNRIMVEVVTIDGGKHIHHLKRKPCGTYEEIEMPGNDR